METNQRRQEEKLQCHSFLPRCIKEKEGVEKEQEKKWKKYTDEIEKNYAVYDNSVLKLENRSE